jgi:hypothetical protein
MATGFVALVSIAKVQVRNNNFAITDRILKEDTLRWQKSG